MTPVGRTAVTQAPAKLNLFLELLGKRSDGFHEIDTVMAAIDVVDSLQVRRSRDPGVRLDVAWEPSLEVLCDRVGLDAGSAQAETVFSIPKGSANLVTRALNAFTDALSIEGGFDVVLRKRIPAGAGMGGASSDAAAALRCAAALMSETPPSLSGGENTPSIHAVLTRLAASIGSDVPFFLGPERKGDTVVADSANLGSSAFARATGRGEVIQSVASEIGLDLVVVYPPVALSTARVYAEAKIPRSPASADGLLQSIEAGGLAGIAASMRNGLSEPASKIVPRIDEIQRIMWQTELKAVQLTGSGSACFGIAKSTRAAKRAAETIRNRLREPGSARLVTGGGTGSGALVFQARTTRVPAHIRLIDSTDAV